MIAAIYARKSTRLGVAIALMLVALGTHRASATTLVAYRTETHFVIAADGLNTPTGRSLGGPLPAPSNVCKVFRAGQAIFSVVGFLPRTFDVRGDVADILSSRLTIQAAANEMVQVLTPKINSWLAQRGPDHVRKFIGKGGELVTQIVFGAFEGPSPAAALIGFQLASVEPPRVTPVKIWSCPHSTLCASRAAYLGQSSVIQKDDHDLARAAQSPADYAASLVQLEIDAGSPGVGAPIAVAELTSAGVSWPRKGACGSGEGAGNG